MMVHQVGCATVNSSLAVHHFSKLNSELARAKTNLKRQNNPSGSHKAPPRNRGWDQPQERRGIQNSNWKSIIAAVFMKC